MTLESKKGLMSMDYSPYLPCFYEIEFEVYAEHFLEATPDTIYSFGRQSRCFRLLPYCIEIRGFYKDIELVSRRLTTERSCYDRWEKITRGELHA